LLLEVVLPDELDDELELLLEDELEPRSPDRIFAVDAETPLILILIS
jgi:hypothetical protein